MSGFGWGGGGLLVGFVFVLLGGGKSCFKGSSLSEFYCS